MSARHIAGIGSRAGKKAPVNAADHYLRKREVEHLRDSVADFLRESGLEQPRVRKPQFGRGGAAASAVKRKGPHRVWQPRFLAAYRRTGSMQEAAKVARVSVNTVKAHLYRHRGAFLSACQDALGQWGWRQLCRMAQREGKRMCLGHRQAEALVGYLVRCGVPMPGGKNLNRRDAEPQREAGEGEPLTSDQ